MKKTKFSPQMEQIIKLGKNTKDQICVQILMNIPLEDLLKKAIYEVKHEEN